MYHSNTLLWSAMFDLHLLRPTNLSEATRFSNNMFTSSHGFSRSPNSLKMLPAFKVMLSPPF